MAGNALGECYKERCRGPLGVRSGVNAEDRPDGSRKVTSFAEVFCESCGEPQPDHPKAKEMAAAQAQMHQAAPTRDPQPEDFVGDYGDRLARVEVQLKQASDRLALLGERVAKLEEAGHRGKK